MTAPPRSTVAGSYYGPYESSLGAVPLLTAEEMQRWDGRAIGAVGVPERVLMENAGRAAARILISLYPRGRVGVVVGKGNNGGDALILARTLRSWGRDVVTVRTGEEEDRSDLLHGWDVESAPAEAAADVFRSTAVLIDGILGTGARGAPRGAAASLIRQMRDSGQPIVALDGPSGVDLTTGDAPGDAVQAAATIAFGAPKRGLLLYPGRAHAGRIVTIEVGFPSLDDSEWQAAVITRAWAEAQRPRFAPNAHKGDLGTLAVVAGRGGVAGAAVLVAAGALRTGCGGIRLVSPAENRLPLQAALPEAIFTERDGGGIDEVMQQADAVVAGPGMGTDGGAQAVLERILSTLRVPALLDADAVTIIARAPELLSRTDQPLLLTPHPGEASRLLGVPTEQVVRDPFAAAEQLRERFGCTVLLKGFPSIVAAPGAPFLVNVAGHAGIATGGMGDTLAGVAGAFLGMGSAPRPAAALALYYAGRAAEIAGLGQSLLPSDVADALPRALDETRARGPFTPEILFDLPSPW